MATFASQREQAAVGLEQLATLVRARHWRADDDTPSLPPTQAAVLHMLAAEPDGLRARQIAARLGISAASLSDTLKAIEGKGWIHRKPDPGDRRASLVRLAADGRRIARRLRHPERGMAALLQALDEPDIGALLRVTQLLVREAQRQGLATGARTCLGCRYFRPRASDDPRRPHFCEFVSQPFGDPELRTDCADHTPADDARFTESLNRFRPPVPSPAETTGGTRLPSDAALPPTHQNRASKG